MSLHFFREAINASKHHAHFLFSSKTGGQGPECAAEWLRDKEEAL